MKYKIALRKTEDGYSVSVPAARFLAPVEEFRRLL